MLAVSDQVLSSPFTTEGSWIGEVIGKTRSQADRQSKTCMIPRFGRDITKQPHMFYLLLETLLL